MAEKIDLLSTLFDSMPVGVIVLDAPGNVVVFNKAEEKLAGRARDRVMGRPFFEEIAPCLNVRDLGQYFTENIGHRHMDREVDFAFPLPHVERPRDVRVRLQSFEVGAAPFALLMIEDRSAEMSIARMKETLQTLLVHDLKNPLASVLANFGFALDHPMVKTDIDLREAMSDGVMASERLQRMLLNLLDISRLETDAVPVERSEVELRPFFEEITAASKMFARLRKATVEVSPTMSVETARMDGAMIRRALENLVDNALRFAKKVELSAHAVEGGVEIVVADNGPGIAPAIRERIFDKFVQVGGQTGNTAQNRGLGLTFVRLAARAHGGESAVHCPPSGGTIFTLRIPTGLTFAG